MSPFPFSSRRRAAADPGSPDTRAAVEPVASPGQAGTAAEPDDPKPAPERVPDDRAELIHQAIDRWRVELQDLAGSSTLTDITQLSGALVDLTQAHPSGIAQLYAGRPTRLSNLVRESAALITARGSARAVLKRADEFMQRYALAPIYLAIGIGHWAEYATAAGGDGEIRLIHSPLMLRPVHLQRVEGPEADYELRLEPGIEINPEFVAALRRCGAEVDVEELAALSVSLHGFSPRATLARLAELGHGHLPDFELVERIHVGPFIHPGRALVDDLTMMTPRLHQSAEVAALAGDSAAKRELAVALPPTDPADRPPDAERGVGDLDPAQQGAIDHVVSGRSLFLEARAGADAPTLLAAILADAAASGRSVVFAPGSRRAGRATIKALEEVGLGDLVLDLQETDWRSTVAQRLRDGMHPWEDSLDDDAIRRLRATLTDVRARLEANLQALHAVREPWGISAFDALQHLASLTSGPVAPCTQVRLQPAGIAALDDDTREEVAQALTRLGHMGGLSDDGAVTPWAAARINSAEVASAALERTQTLAELLLPKMLSDVGRVSRETGMERATSMESWLEQIGMLMGVRDSLDAFTPVVFERSAADMVGATASREWRAANGVEMSAAVRRRLTRQARDLVRPGRAVADLHAALARVQEQREVWRRHCPAEEWPRVPQSLGDVERTAHEVRDQLRALEPVLEEDLFGMELHALRERLLELGNDPAALRYLPELNAITQRLDELGLADLLADLRQRRVGPHLAAAELRLCWWASVLESILAGDPALAEHDGGTLNALADHFRALDRAQVRSLPGPVRRAVGRRLRRAIELDKPKAQELWRELSQPHLVNLRSLRAAYRDLVTAARPIWVVPPMLAGQVLPPDEQIDLMVIDGAQHLPTAHAVAALARAGQVVLAGDPGRAGPGLVSELAGTLPAVSLPTDRAEREEHIAAFLAGHGYEGVVDSVPTRPAPSTMRLELVSGYGMPAIGAVAVEGVDAEVQAVLALLRQRLWDYPEETRAVISLSAVTAERIREAIAADRELAPLLAQPDEFTVVDAEEAAGLRRDTVILSVGFGKTPHGRVLHRFGPVSSPEGLGIMIDVLDVVRRDLLIVSCIAAGDLDRDRLRHPGALLLADLLEAAAGDPVKGSSARGLPDQGETDQLLLDLEKRLRRDGLVTVPRYGFEGGKRIPLAVGHPDRPGELFVGVLTDDEDYVAEPSMRRRDRHWVERLERHGWVAHMAFATAVFMDPQREANAIRAKVRAAMATVPPGNASPPAVEPPAIEQPVVEPPAVEQPAGAAEEDPLRRPAPEVESGLGIGSYTDDQLDDVLVWLSEDGTERTDEEMVEAIRAHLQIPRRGIRVEEALASTVRRYREAMGYS